MLIQHLRNSQHGTLPANVSWRSYSFGQYPAGSSHQSVYGSLLLSKNRAYFQLLHQSRCHSLRAPYHCPGQHSFQRRINIHSLSSLNFHHSWNSLHDACGYHLDVVPETHVKAGQEARYGGEHFTFPLWEQYDGRFQGHGYDESQGAGYDD